MSGFFNVSEKFYSIQGEGVTVGMPAYFMRLQSCNLCCGGPKASLLKAGKATWYCDTEPVWRQGTKQTFDQVIADWKEEGVYQRILNGQINVIWTGGEPTLPKHRKAIKQFCDYIKLTEPASFMVNEIETNGTLDWEIEGFYFNKEVKEVPGCIHACIHQVNCSPKLANSGMDAALRINPKAIQMVKNHHNGWFKFVISTEEDIKEFEDEFIKPFDIPASRVIIMPGVDNLADLPERTKFLFEMTKKYGYRGITRQHILAWNKTTGC